MVISKKCTKCGVVKPLEVFAKNAGRPDGHGTWCLECMRASYHESKFPTLYCCSLCGQEKERKAFRFNPKCGLKTECLECEKEWLRCVKCNTPKKHEEFPPAKKMSTGRHGWCHECHAKQQKAKWDDPEFRAKQKAYEQTEPVKLKARARGRTEKAKEQLRRFRQTERGKYLRRKHECKRRMHLEQAECTMTFEEWKELLGEYNNCCCWCKRPFSEELPPTQDHLIPVSKGGSHTKENVAPSCRSCNSSKKDGEKPKSMPLPEDS